MTFAAESSVHPCVSAPTARAILREGRPGRRCAQMAGLVVREAVTLAGLVERARVARAFVEEVLGSGHPCGADAALLVSELFGNSVVYSGSGAPGETVTVAVRTDEHLMRVEVTDRSGPETPEPVDAARDDEGGRGLQIVADLATRWGWRRRGGRTVTWFEIQALLQPMQHSAVSGKGLNSPDVDVSGS